MCRMFFDPDERLEPVAIDEPLTPGEILPRRRHRRDRVATSRVNDSDDDITP